MKKMENASVACYSQMNNFVVHFKKEHMPKKCSQCNGKDLCTVCKLFLEQAKLEWQLKPLKSNLGQNFPNGSHICQVCKMSFGQKSHLNAHFKLKHSLSKPRACTEMMCKSIFAQINNFVVHFKNKHFVHCDDKSCNECLEKLDQAKTLWRSAAIVSLPEVKQIPAVVEPVPPDDKPVLTEKSQDKMFIDAETENKGSIETSITEKLTMTKTLWHSALNEPSLYAKPIPSDVIVSLDHASPEESLGKMFVDVESEKTANMASLPLKGDEDIISILSQAEKRSSEQIEEEKPSKISKFSENISKIAAVDLQEMATLPGDITKLSTAEGIIDYFDDKKAQLVVCDGALDDISKISSSTQALSERAFIRDEIEKKHMLRANVYLVHREAAKYPLDTNFVKKRTSLVERDWILVTYFRNNKHIKSTEYAKICEEVGVHGDQRIEKLMEYKISCEEAMGLYPRGYLHLKSEFMNRGSNTEVTLLFI